MAGVSSDTLHHFCARACPENVDVFAQKDSHCKAATRHVCELTLCFKAAALKRGCTKAADDRNSILATAPDDCMEFRPSEECIVSNVSCVLRLTSKTSQLIIGWSVDVKTQ